MSIEIVLIPVAIALIGGAVGSWKGNQQNARDTFCSETRFADSDLLHTALEHRGYPPLEEAETLSVAIGTSIARFESGTGPAFTAIFEGDVSLDEARSFLLELDEEYGRVVQESVYKRLMVEAKRRGFVLETEEITEDNSVVLRFAVG